MWRESFVEVVVIKLDKSGMIDLKDIEEKLKSPAYKNRKKIASFSACSNVTGILTKVYDIAKICHENNTLIFFDFAAIAPYKKIDMNKDKKSYYIPCQLERYIKSSVLEKESITNLNVKTIF